MDNGGIHRAVHIAGLVLLGKNHGHAHFQGHCRRDGNAGGLNGQDFIDPRVLIEPCELPGHLSQECRVNLLIQEGSHLENAAGKDFSFLQDLLFHCFHMDNAPSVKE